MPGGEFHTTDMSFDMSTYLTKMYIGFNTTMCIVEEMLFPSCMKWMVFLLNIGGKLIYRDFESFRG